MVSEFNDVNVTGIDVKRDSKTAKYLYGMGVLMSDGIVLRIIMTVHLMDDNCIYCSNVWKQESDGCIWWLL